MQIRENEMLKPYTTFKMGGSASFIADITKKEDILELVAFAEEKKLPLHIMGGGSNTIFSDTSLHMCVGVMKVAGFSITKEEGSAAYVQIGAGEDWDTTVARTIRAGLSGIEALSAIPGSAGATPIQNVGAYGQEIAQVLESVEVYDKKEGFFRILTSHECKFSYRDSIFKHEGKNRYIIASITLKLSKNPPTIPQYPDVINYFKTKNITNPTLSEIREAIIEIRSKKLPDPKNVASCGSFFKNPFITKLEAKHIKTRYPGAVLFEVDARRYKIGAGWMIETLGFKGRDFGKFLMYSHNALVLVHKGGATRAELASLVSYLTNVVYQEFGVHLEPEPVFVG